VLTNVQRTAWRLRHVIELFCAAAGSPRIAASLKTYLHDQGNVKQTILSQRSNDRKILDLSKDHREGYVIEMI
jgi:hypothetical protein